MKECDAVLTGDRLRLATGAVTWTFRWNEGHLVGEEVAAAAGGVRWPLQGEAPDCEFPGPAAPASDGRLAKEEVAASPVRPAHLRIEVRTRFEDLQVKRVFRLYPGCPAVGCDIYLRGRSGAPWRVGVAAAAGLDNIEDAPTAGQERFVPTTVQRLPLPHPHMDIRSVQFHDITDRRNNLVHVREVQPYLQPLFLAGNLLLCRDRLADRSLFLLKEAPCSDVQLASPGFDFLVTSREIQLVGIGLTPEDLESDAWTRGYGFALGIAPADELTLLHALRSYQRCLRLRRSDRDDMVMLNTWGDRGQGDRVHEAGVLGEIAAAARLGATHLQLDHGWESTQDPAKVWPLDLRDIWRTPRFWQVNPIRFPRGLEPCLAAAQAAGIELCLWFNPSAEADFAHWRDDARVLIELYRRHGIRTFKIDGVQMPTKRAETNFRRLLDTVQAAAGGGVVFNLDITAGRRGGYHGFTEYGNLFLENRYTDWGNYYPHWTLRNLWQLSRYVPAQNLQIEFLNRWRNTGKYAADDPLAPHRVPFDYCFAVALMAQPLAWFEAARLPEEGFALAEVIRTYRRHMAAIHAGVILPIGEEPSGVGWTGFQSMGDGSGGYLLVFREWNRRSEARLRCWGLAGRHVRCAPLIGHGTGFEAHAGCEGDLVFRLPDPFSFALFQYACE